MTAAVRRRRRGARAAGPGEGRRAAGAPAQGPGPLGLRPSITRRTLAPLLALLLLAGCAGTGTARAEAGPDPLIAVSNMLHPPFSSWGADGRAVGIEVDLVEAAARELGRSVTWVERPFGELLAAVAAGEADVAASTLGITPERARIVAFTRPYFRTSIVALVRVGPGEPTRLGDLAGRRIGTERGTTTVGAARRRLPDAVRVTERPDDRTWAELLVGGEIDAMVLDRSHAEKFMADAGVRFDVLDEPLQDELFALAVGRDARALLAALNDAIDRAE